MRGTTPAVVATRPPPPNALSVPINPDQRVVDRFERYTMPQLICVHTGKGKSTTTRLENVAAVARALGRPPSYLVRYFQYALSIPAQGSQLSGLIQADKLEVLLLQFIRTWVVCCAPHCGLPECQLVVPPEDQPMEPILLQCSACGHCGMPATKASWSERHGAHQVVISKHSKMVRYIRANRPAQAAGTQPITSAASGAVSAPSPGRQLQTPGAFESHCRRLARWIKIDTLRDPRAGLTWCRGGADGEQMPGELLTCILARLDPEARYRCMQWLVLPPARAPPPPPPPCMKRLALLQFR